MQIIPAHFLFFTGRERGPGEVKKTEKIPKTGVV